MPLELYLPRLIVEGKILVQLICTRKQTDSIRRFYSLVTLCVGGWACGWCG